jgi:hypothetical protein
VAACSDPAGPEPRLFFQRVPESKIAKNRVHLDIHVDVDRKQPEVERLVQVGAELIETHSDRGPLTSCGILTETNSACINDLGLVAPFTRCCCSARRVPDRTPAHGLLDGASGWPHHAGQPVPACGRPTPIHRGALVFAARPDLRLRRVRDQEHCDGITDTCDQLTFEGAPA